MQSLEEIFESDDVSDKTFTQDQQTDQETINEPTPDFKSLTKKFSGLEFSSYATYLKSLQGNNVHSLNPNSKKLDRDSIVERLAGLVLEMKEVSSAIALLDLKEKDSKNSDLSELIQKLQNDLNLMSLKVSPRNLSKVDPLASMRNITLQLNDTTKTPMKGSIQAGYSFLL